MKRKYPIWTTLAICCLILIIINGHQDLKIYFKVDNITIALLILAFLPYLQEIIGTIKVGGTELQFRDYVRDISEVDKYLFFLDAISTKKTWTFYDPRPGEEALGSALDTFIQKLREDNSEKLDNKIKEWLKSENENHKYFAAEVIGHLERKELRDICKKHFGLSDFKKELENWRLNCLWAYSRCEENKYETLILKLKEPINEENRKWIIKACKQMLKHEKDENSRVRLDTAIQDSNENILKSNKSLE